MVHGTLTGGGLGFRLLIGGDWPGFSGWLAGALFVPTFALALGVWSGSSKLFEALYTPVVVCFECQNGLRCAARRAQSFPEGFGMDSMAAEGESRGYLEHYFIQARTVLPFLQGALHLHYLQGRHP